MINTLKFNEFENLKKFLKDVSTLLLVTLFAKSLRYLSTIIIARNISIEDYGTYAYFIQLSGYLCTIIEIGLPTSIIIFHIRRGISLSQIFLVIMTFILSIFFTLFIGLSFYQVLSGNTDFILSGSLSAHHLLLYSFVLIIGSILMASVRAKEQNLKYSFFTFLLGSFFFTSIVITKYFFGLSLLSAYFSIFAASFLWVVILLITNLDLFHKSINKRLPWISDLFKFGLKNYITRLLSSFVQLLPYIFLISIEETKILGFFGVAVTMMSIFRLLSQSVSMLITSRLSSLSDESSYSFSFVISLILILIFSITLPILLNFMEQIIELIYGFRYLDAVPLISLCLIAVVLEILIIFIIRPFITSSNPVPSFQWIVYLTVISVMTLVFLINANINTEYDISISLGYSMIFGNLSGLLVSIVMFIYLLNKSKRNA